MAVIGLTGSFGTGKTFVASLFKRLGAKVIDADRLAHRCLARNSRAYKKIVAFFGERVLDGRHNIDRRALGRIVFDDERKLKKLCAITHPEVIRAAKKEIAKSPKGRIIVIDAPLLIEANLAGAVDALVVVTSSRKKQVERCMKKFGMAKGEVYKRIRRQMPLAKKVKLADFIIDNNSSRSQTRRQVAAIWRKVWK